jgi:hypothetical protein
MVESAGLECLSVSAGLSPAHDIGLDGLSGPDVGRHQSNGHRAMKINMADQRPGNRQDIKSQYENNNNMTSTI